SIVFGRDPETEPDERSAERAPSASASPGLAVACALLGVPVLAVLWSGRAGANTPVRGEIEIPRAGQGWQGPLTPSRRWAPEFAGASLQQRAAFQSEAGLRVETYRASYASQRAGAKLIYYSNRLGNTDWLELSRSPSRRALRTGTLAVRTLLEQTPDGSRWLIDYYYVVDGVEATREWAAQLLYGVFSWGKPGPSGVVAVAAACLGGCDSAERALQAYWSAVDRTAGSGTQTSGLSNNYTTGVLQNKAQHLFPESR